MRKLLVGVVTVVWGLAFSSFGQNRVLFDNQSGDPAFVKLIGPTQTEVDVPNGTKVGTDAAAGRYVIKVRYGTPGRYHYSKGEEFEVTQTATTRSETTITLHKVLAGNYDTEPIGEKEFGEVTTTPAGNQRHSTNTVTVTDAKGNKIVFTVKPLGGSTATEYNAEQVPPAEVDRNMQPGSFAVGCYNKATGQILVCPDDKVERLKKVADSLDLSTSAGRSRLVEAFVRTMGEEATWRSLVIRTKDGTAYRWPPSNQKK